MAELNRPTPDGIELGEHIARLTERAADNLAVQLQGQNALHLMPRPCESCAFKRGTIPNGCTDTLLDAIKCVMEGVPFFCHMKSGGLCRGYFIARSCMHGAIPIETPWEFSHDAIKDQTPEEPVCITINPVETDPSSSNRKWFGRCLRELRLRRGEF